MTESNAEIKSNPENPQSPEQKFILDLGNLELDLISQQIAHNLPKSDNGQETPDDIRADLTSNSPRALTRIEKFFKKHPALKAAALATTLVSTFIAGCSTTGSLLQNQNRYSEETYRNQNQYNLQMERLENQYNADLTRARTPEERARITARYRARNAEIGGRANANQSRSAERYNLNRNRAIINAPERTINDFNRAVNNFNRLLKSIEKIGK